MRCFRLLRCTAYTIPTAHTIKPTTNNNGPAKVLGCFLTSFGIPKAAKRTTATMRMRMPRESMHSPGNVELLVENFTRSSLLRCSFLVCIVTRSQILNCHPIMLQLTYLDVVYLENSCEKCISANWFNIVDVISARTISVKYLFYSICYTVI